MSGIINSAGSRSGVIGTTEIDYEEGTWTPSLTFSTTTNCTYTTREGSYVKIGELVFASLRITLLNKVTSDGVLSVNMPFTSHANAGSYGSGVLGFANNWTTTGGTLTYNRLLTLDPSSSAMYIRGHNTTGDYFSFSEGDLEDNGDMVISISYRTA